MGKHQKPYSPQQAETLTREILKKPKVLSRWLALLSAVQVVDARETRLGVEPQSDSEGNDIIKYIDEKAPEIEEFLNEEILADSEYS